MLKEELESDGSAKRISELTARDERLAILPKRLLDAKPFVQVAVDSVRRVSLGTAIKQRFTQVPVGQIQACSVVTPYEADQRDREFVEKYKSQITVGNFCRSALVQ